MHTFIPIVANSNIFKVLATNWSSSVSPSSLVPLLLLLYVERVVDLLSLCSCSRPAGARVDGSLQIRIVGFRFKVYCRRQRIDCVVDRREVPLDPVLRRRRELVQGNDMRLQHSDVPRGSSRIKEQGEVQLHARQISTSNVVCQM